MTTDRDWRTDITQIVFIEGDVPEPNALEAGTAQGVKAVVLNPGGDGMRQMAAYLSAHGISGVSRVSVVAHGSDARIDLGSGVLSPATMGRYQSELETIGGALRPGGTIQLYSCNVAQAAPGVAFLRQLSTATGGAGIGAASSIVGSCDAGGCWDLDVEIGSAEVVNPFTAATLSAYQGALAASGKLVFAASPSVESASVSGGTLGTPTTLASSFTLPVGLAIDSTLGQYFVADTDFTTFDTIESGSLSGGAVTTVYNVTAPSQQTVSDMVVNPATGTLYFSTAFDGTSAPQGGVYSINIGNGSNLVTSAPTSLLTEHYVNAIALDPTNNLLFAAEGQAGVSNSLWVVNLNTGSTTNLTSALGSAIRSALSSTGDTTLVGATIDPATQKLYFSTVDLPAVQNDAVNPTGVGTNIFTASYTVTGDTVSIGASQVLYSGIGAGVPIYIKVDTADNVLYETSGLDSTIYSLSLSGGGALTAAATTGATTGPLAFANSSLCFCRGTLIDTPAGEVQVEKLKAGDMVMTAHNGPRAVVWVGTGKVLATRGRRTAATPVIVLKGALGDNLPHQDLRITKAHSLFWEGVLIPVEFLVNHKTIIWDDRAQEVEIYHVELESHDVLIANGVPAESYRDDGNRWLFNNVNPGWHLPPAEPYAPVVTGGPIVDAAWRRLLDRAGARALPPLTEEPDLHLVVDGKRVEIADRRGSVRIFRLKGCPTSVSVGSRQGVPAELGLARDPRCLGVALRHIAIRSGTRFVVLNADDERLVDGFHDYEIGGKLRWTDGNAVLPAEVFAGFTGAFEVVLTLGGATQYLDDGRRVAA